MKIFRRVIFYVLIMCGVLLIALTVSILLFKDKIISQFIREANKQLNTPVKVGKFDVSIFDQFPHLSIVLHEVYVEDSQPGPYPLLTAKKISFQMNGYEVLKGRYTIRGLRVYESETNLKINDRGENNYTILKEKASSGSDGSLSFELKNVGLENSRVSFLDLESKKNLVFISENLTASIRSSQNIYEIAADGQLTTEDINIEGSRYLNGKSFKVKSDLTYDDARKILTIRPSTLMLKNSAFTVSGDYKWKEKNTIDIKTEGRNTDVQTLLSLLPETIAKKVSKYKSKGNVYFNAKLKGELTKKKTPSLSVEFGFTNATIYHPDYKSRIEGATLTGSFASNELANPRTAALVLKNISGRLNGEPFAANFNIYNFINPEVICNFKGRVNAASLLGFYPVENLKDITGSLFANVSFQGKIELLKSRSTAQKVSTQGTIDLQAISFKYGTQRIPLQNLTGTLQFNNNDLALSNVSGKFGNSDFLLNGFFKNAITFLLFENQPVGIETDLKSDLLDVDQLFDIGFSASSESHVKKYEFSISRNVYLNFNCDVKHLRYKKFKAQQIRGDLLVKNQVAVSRNLTLKTMGGSLTLSGIVDANNPKAIDVVCTSRLTDIYIDSAFYVFENFQQNFIEDRHLKGQTTADVALEMTLDQTLKLFQETLVADISFTIRNGQLNNFEPMKKLNKYLDDEGLSKLRFSNLKNDIHIEKKTIYIPQMEVRSNVTDIMISGTHTFDQHIDYRLISPLRARKKLVDHEAIDAIELDGTGQSKLFLKIVGTTDNYRVVYDTESVRKKIATDLKKEVQELKDAFKNKGMQKKKEVELQTDEYFDWDDN